MRRTRGRSAMSLSGWREAAAGLKPTSVLRRYYLGTALQHCVTAFIGGRIFKPVLLRQPAEPRLSITPWPDASLGCSRTRRVAALISPGRSCDGLLGPARLGMPANRPASLA